MTQDLPDDEISADGIDPVMTTEAAQILHVSAETVRSWVRTGRLPALRTKNGVSVFDRPVLKRVAKERAAARR